jgi:meiosis-specific protein HOP1
MIFGIFLDPNNPENLQEGKQVLSTIGYTFGFSYPSHDQFCITLNHGHKELLSLKNKHEIIRATTEILRRLLVLTQTLAVREMYKL